MAPIHPIVEAIKVNTPIIMRPIAGVTNTTVGNVVCPVAVCCSVLQCVAVCCSVLQCDAV